MFLTRLEWGDKIGPTTGSGAISWNSRLFDKIYKMDKIILKVYE